MSINSGTYDLSSADLNITDTTTAINNNTDNQNVNSVYYIIVRIALFVLICAI